MTSGPHIHEDGPHQDGPNRNGEPQPTAAPGSGADAAPRSPQATQAPPSSPPSVAEGADDAAAVAEAVGAADPASPGTAADQLEDGAGDELALARRELAERTLDLQRLQAEYLNYKRRVERDRELVRQNATFQVLSELLPVLDGIDRAREHGELEGGLKAVAEPLERIVAGLGLTKFGAKGDEFDPNFHEALMHGHSPDVTTTTVDVVAHAGYRIGDRVVRAARVTVLDPESGSATS